jgi:phosphatidate cytidylyltransferase
VVTGVAWIAVVLSVTWVVDSIAYFAGRAFGQHPFSPGISPKKTWEGTIAGVLAGTLVGMAWAPVMLWTTVAGAAVGFVVSWAAVLGDLAESSLKRHAGLKDAGTVLPGHGGLLDRVDSLAFSSVVIFLVGTVDRTAHILRFGP